MGSICLAWLPTMYRKYQKSMRSMFLELEWGCRISARGTLLCGCRALKGGLLAEKSLFFSSGDTPGPPVVPRESSNTGSGNEMRERDPCSPRAGARRFFSNNLFCATFTNSAGFSKCQNLFWFFLQAEQFRRLHT